MESLECKIEKLQVQTGVFGDVCEFVYCAIEAISGDTGFMKRYNNALLPSVMQTLTEEARRIEAYIVEVSGIVKGGVSQ